MRKQVYNYRPDSGEYLDHADAEESPLEEGVVLVPAFATLQAPPDCAAHQCAVFDSSHQQWKLVPDWRGVTLYSTADGSRISAPLGKTPEQLAATELPRPGAVYVWQNGAWAVDAALQAAADKAAQDQEITAALALAARQIVVLQDAVDLGIATADEEASYKAWRTYRVLVSRLKADAKYPAVTLPPQPAVVV